MKQKTQQPGRIKIKSMENIINFFKNPKFEAFLWMTVNGFIGVVITVLTDLSWEYAPIIIAVLNTVTKYINTTYIKK